MRLSHLQTEIGSLELSAVFEMGKTKVIDAVYGPCEMYSNRSSLSPEVTTKAELQTEEFEDNNGSSEY
ncbi:exosome complex component RRP41 homolog isoform X1 [Tanacetum coccineum]